MAGRIVGNTASLASSVESMLNVTSHAVIACVSGV